MIGSSLCHYRIEGILGTGGMGSVYRALDTHLDRAIALKVLAPGSIANPDRRRRFAQEAKTASSLNHPNIITIYDIGKDDIDGQSVDFIAMELVGGETLDHILAARRLPVKEAVNYAIQITDALAAAHAAGIIHRDLKPSNVMVTPQGLVKVLDFGLAKMTEAQAASVDAFAATEIASKQFQTEEGTIIGTVAYMSPEQAEGKRLDARSDVFSFGSVLYEMLAGKRAFPGDSKVSMLSAILLKDPEPLDCEALGVPHQLDVTLERCLRKEPPRRWQSMADLKVALDDVQSDLKSGKAVVMPKPAPLAQPVMQSRRRWLLPAVLGAGLLAGVVPATYLAGRLNRPHPPSFERLTFRRGDLVAAKFAPGGSVVYGAEWDGAPMTLFSVQPGGRESRPLGIPSGLILSISKSGEMAILNGVSALDSPGTLARVPFSGGTPRDVLEDVVAADWGPDGESLAVSRSAGGKKRVEYPIGTVLVEGEGRPAPWVRISPRGDLVAFFEYDVEVGDYALAIAGGGKPKRTLSTGWRAVSGLNWSPKGDELWFSGLHSGHDPALYAINLSGRDRVLADAPGMMNLLDVDSQGRALVSTADARIGIRCSRDGADERELAWLDASRLYEISNDGRMLVFVEVSYGEGRNLAIYLRRTDGSPAVKLGFGNRPSLAPDSKWVACIHREAASSQLLFLPTGAGESRMLRPDGFRYESVEWFPDQRHVLVTANEPGRPVRTYMREVAGGPMKALTPEGVRASRVSPDGHTVTFIEKGQIYLLPVDGGVPREFAKVSPTESVLRWTSDASALYVRHDDPETGAVEITRLEISNGKSTHVMKLNPPEPGAHLYGAVTLSADGKSYAYSYQRDLETLYLVKGLE